MVELLTCPAGCDTCLESCTGDPEDETVIGIDCNKVQCNVREWSNWQGFKRYMRLYGERMSLKNYFEFWSALSGFTYDLMAYRVIDLFAEHTICLDELVVICEDLPLPKENRPTTD